MQVRDAQPNELLDALGLVLGPRADRAADRSQVSHFMRYIASQGLQIERCILVTHADDPAGAVATIASPGRTTMVLTSAAPAASRLATALGDAVLRALDDARRSGAILAQALIAPHDAQRDHLLRDAGLEHITTLQCLVGRTQAPAPPPMPFEMTHYSEATHRRFTVALMASYEGSLDCPRLAGHRDVEDIIASHRATGIHDPQQWFLATANDHDIGVLLLTGVPLRRALEIVYVGVSREARGAGHGAALVRYAQQCGWRADCDHIILAVDEHNGPARRIYDDAGFVETDQRAAWIAFL